MKYNDAHVVILFVNAMIGPHWFKVVRNMGVQDDFIWIGSDGIWFTDKQFIPERLFCVQFLDIYYPTFDEEYRSLSIANTSSKRWMKMDIERLYGCSWNESSGFDNCSNYEVDPYNEVAIPSYVYMAIDATMTLVYAIDKLLNNTSCSPEFPNTSSLDKCVNGPDLLQYMKNTSFDGTSGRVEFDKFGDMKGRTWSPVVTWLQDEGLMWRADVNNLFAANLLNCDTIPESICSKPCHSNTYTVLKDVTCCWECKPCRSHEVPNAERTSCDPCEKNFWPNEETGSECIPISPVFIQWQDSIALGLVCLSLVGLLSCSMIGITWIKHSENRLIKASNKQISAIILFGVILAFSSVFVFMIRPSVVSCFTRLIGFHVSVSLIYAPLLVKTNAVYRIFAAGKKGVKKPRFINSTSQMVMLLSQLLIQASKHDIIMFSALLSGIAFCIIT